MSKNYDLTSRIDMIDGRIFAAGSVEGARQLLEVLLKSWTTHAAAALITDLKLLETAISEVFSLSPQEIESKIGEAGNQVPADEMVPFAEIFEDGWFRTRSLLRKLNFGAYLANLSFAIGPDYVMKLGENAPTPDFLICRNPELVTAKYYLCGAANVACETLGKLKGIDCYKRLYAEYGVSELWIIDSENDRFTPLLREPDGSWRETGGKNGNKYSSPTVEGLSLDLDKFFDRELTAFDDNFLQYPGGRNFKLEKTDGIEWGDIRFAPRIDLEPERIGFDEFIAWSPESKFEWSDGRLTIGSDTGTRNCLGMLMQSLGLVETISLYPVQEAWLAALFDRRIQVQNEALLRANLMTQAKRAKQTLEQKFGLKNLAVHGDWVTGVPSLWDKITLVVPDEQQFDWYNAQTELRKESDDDVTVLKYRQLTKSEKQQVAEFS